MPHDQNQNLSELHAWLAAVAPEVGVDAADVPTGDILELATAVAHGVLRPGVPVTAFLAGLAVGRSTAPDAVTRLTSRAHGWRDRPGAPVK